MKKVVKKLGEKYVTESTFKKFEGKFEGSMQAIAQSFARVDESLDRINKTLITHEEVMQDILKQIRMMNEESKYFRQSLSNLNTDGISYDRRIENLNMRVERLESKTK